ncbi:MAG TPA: type I DNA topoisomerase [Candidatus Bipolaricaulota bacterium]|nr:type I DNA topoisomerase [Candidatus Bipolaricaulota bacterium]
MKNLIIVESPTKAKTITKFLPRAEYTILSSFGHVRDLPKTKMGVDIEHNFEPQYVIPPKAKKNVGILKEAAKKADMIYFATDEDREGEAIAWHLAHILKPKKNKSERITFHEITKAAIEKALQTPRTIDLNLVNAQQARRILDRLVGYELSPFLWKKVAKGLSAGRVQSVSVRLIVEREREIQAFKKEEYWTIEAIFSKDKNEFPAKLHIINGKTLKKLDIKNEKQAKEILDKLKDQNYKVSKIELKETTKKAPAPFKTSTLQQDANSKLHFSAKQTMMLAQQLYEGIELGSEGSAGMITYMRTDSLNLSEEFKSDAKDFISQKFGKEYLAVGAKTYKKSKGAQEAHEAIRPTVAGREPETIKNFLNNNQYKLYKLIWERALAGQMADAKINQTSVDIESKDGEYVFRASGAQIKFDGWQKIYGAQAQETLLPALSEGDDLDAKEISPLQHFTQPPARYSEATLVKALEERGIGRPSTYAPTIATIQDRNYVIKEDRKLAPTDIAFVVNDLLVAHFPQIVDYDFTAHMEEDLDNIAEGKKEWQPLIEEFYTPFKENLTKKDKEISKKEITEEETKEVCEKCGSPMIIKMGRFGKFLACSNYPECKNTKNIVSSNGTEIVQEETEATNEKCDKCGAPMTVKHGRYGKFLGCSKYPECKNIKPILKPTGVKCPNCGKGDIIERKSKRGKTFYGCSNYPECKTAFWSKPVDKKCPDCGSQLVFGAKGTIRCSNKECKHTEMAES